MSEQSVNTTTARRSGRKPWWLWPLVGFAIGALLILGIRFATYRPEHTHYHANFAVYINGERESFKDPKYYQEVKICDAHHVSPQARTHMHNSESGLVHVHAEAVTWGAFFENLGWYVGPDFIRSTEQLYQADDTNKLNIVLNGEDMTDITTITNEVIGNKDQLLISYGPADPKTINQQYESVPDSAAEANAKKDPAACGGSETPTIKQRFEHLF